jgi:hypothetical protein
MTRANEAREKLWKGLTCRTGLPGFHDRHIPGVGAYFQPLKNKR